MTTDVLWRSDPTSRAISTPAPSVQATLAALILLFMAPMLALVMLWVWLEDGGSPFFAQSRIGRNGRPFRCWKFRSMRVDAEARLADHLAHDPTARAEWEENHKLRNDPRVTTSGTFLRRSSIDELPQLFNVVRGEMNLVGPRPIVEAEVKRYGRYFREYCSVRPGITGLWQVSGRSDTSYRRRVAIDVVYARRRSAVLDSFVLLMTLPAVFKSRGAY